MANVQNGIKTLPKISAGWVGRTNVTDDRQTTDGQATAYRERDREFVKFYGNPSVTFEYRLPWSWWVRDRDRQSRSLSLCSSWGLNKRNDWVHCDWLDNEISVEAIGQWERKSKLICTGRWSNPSVCLIVAGMQCPAIFCRLSCLSENEHNFVL